MAAFSALARFVRRAAAAPELPAFIEAGGRRAPLVAVGVARARRLSLRVDAAAGVVRLSLPPRTAASTAARFVDDHRHWLAVRVARLPEARPFEPGASFPFDGGELVVDWAPGRPRGVARDGDLLRAGGPLDTLHGRVERWLRAAALAELTPATAVLAARLGRPDPCVAIGDPRGRWGSCSSAGRVRYSWRLILAPVAVRASVVAHEAAHLVHPNHGREFWRLAHELDCGHAAARRWLAANGAALHWVGRAN